MRTKEWNILNFQWIKSNKIIDYVLISHHCTIIKDGSGYNSLGSAFLSTITTQLLLSSRRISKEKILRMLKMSTNIPNNHSCMLLRLGKRKDKCSPRKIWMLPALKAPLKRLISSLSPNRIKIDTISPLRKSKQLLSLTFPFSLLLKNWRASNKAEETNKVLQLHHKKTRRDFLDSWKITALKRWSSSV